MQSDLKYAASTVTALPITISLFVSSTFKLLTTAAAALFTSTTITITTNHNFIPPPPPRSSFLRFLIFLAGVSQETLPWLCLFLRQTLGVVDLSFALPKMQFPRALLAAGRLPSTKTFGILLLRNH
ncbi:hypothetical protein E2C01_049939 [Portunus trituberculatus]|uniref:Uncharacterized protein n=1 Tax=Portunus trituberculatus TaxID=210409 RepID=A0A5B7G7P0_PORTR|nr:hypothetical protein [Portunus trituberculatus]